MKFMLIKIIMIIMFNKIYHQLKLRIFDKILYTNNLKFDNST